MLHPNNFFEKKVTNAGRSWDGGRKKEMEGQTCADTFCAVEEQEGDDGHVPLGFDLIVVFFQIIEQGVVHRVEDRARDWSRLGEDVTRRGVVFPTLVARPVLAVG